MRISAWFTQASDMFCRQARPLSCACRTQIRKRLSNATC